MLLEEEMEDRVRTATVQVTTMAADTATAATTTIATLGGVSTTATTASTATVTVQGMATTATTTVTTTADTGTTTTAATTIMVNRTAILAASGKVNKDGDTTTASTEMETQENGICYREQKGTDRTGNLDRKPGHGRKPELEGETGTRKTNRQETGTGLRENRWADKRQQLDSG